MLIPACVGKRALMYKDWHVSMMYWYTEVNTGPVIWQAAVTLTQIVHKR